MKSLQRYKKAFSEIKRPSAIKESAQRNKKALIQNLDQGLVYYLESLTLHT
jgi:hypothetical protein